MRSSDVVEETMSNQSTSTFKLPLSPTTSTQTLEIPSRSPPKPSISLLFSFLTRHDLLFLVLPAVSTSIMSGAVAPFMTLVVGKVFNAFSQYPVFGANEVDKHRLLHDTRTTAFELLGLAFGAFMLSSITSSLWIWTGERNLLAVRKRVYHSVTRKDLVWFDTETGKDSEDDLGAGGLMAKFTRETDEVRTATSLACGMLVQYLTTITVCLILGLTRSWALTLVILSAVPVLILIQAISQGMASPKLAAERAHTATAATLVDRVVVAIATVKAFNAQSFEEANISQVLDKIQVASDGAISIWGVTSSLSHFSTMAMFVQGFWFGAKLVRAGTITPGDVTTVFWACLIATSNLQMCIPQLIVIAKGKFAMASLLTLAESTPKPSLGRSTSTLYTPLRSSKAAITLRGIIPDRCRGDIELSNVTFAYPSRPTMPVLRNVNIYLAAQDTTFIVGSSGSGKSTIAHLLQRMYDISKGCGMISLDNQDLSYCDEDWSRDHISSVSQTCILFDMTVHENVAMGLAGPWSRRRPESVKRSEVENVCRAALMHDFICGLPDGYDTKLGNGGANLSGGQKQRLAIARAMLRNPTVLILDEATSALDATSRILVFEAIRKWRSNMTTVVITHDLSQIQSGDFVYVLKSGECIEKGYRHDLEDAKKTEFCRMLREQGAAGGFPEKRDADLSGEAQVESLLEKAEEELDAGEVTAKAIKRQTLYRPLTMSNWMFDVISDLTKPASAVAPDATEEKVRPVSRFIPVDAFSGQPPVYPRRQSLHIDVSSLVSPPPAYSPSRRYSLQFTPSSPTSASLSTASFFSSTVVEEDIADEKHEARVLKPSQSTSTLVSKKQKRVRTKWDPAVLAALAEVKVEKAEPSDAHKQLSTFALLLEIWPTIPKKPFLILGIVCSIVSGAMTPIFSFFLSRLVFQVTSGAADMSAINLWGGVALTLAAGDGLFVGLKYMILEYVAMDWVNKVRKTAINLMLAQDKKWFDKSENSPVRLVQILIKDGDDARTLIATVLAQALVVTSMLGVGLIWALVQGWQLTLVGFAIAPFFITAMAVQTHLVAKCEHRNKRAREAVAKGYYDAISNVRGIRAMGFERTFQEKFDKSVDQAHTTGVRGAFVEGGTHGVASALIYLAEAVLFYVGAVLIANGTYTTLRMFQVLNLVVFTVTIGSQLMSFTERIAKSVQATSDLNTLLKLTKLTDERKGFYHPSVAGQLSFRNVEFCYPERPNVPVLTDVSLEIKENECVAIVGASGSGKSTIASLLQRLYEPTSGSIHYGIFNLNEVDVHFLREHVAVVSQQPNLFDATIAENIAYGSSSLSDEDIEVAARAANVHDFIMSLPKGYATMVGENASLISGGQAQRLQIARALARPSSILILDECTSALDSANQAAVIETIKRAKVGRTTLMVTHKPQVMRMCDRIVLVSNGVIAEQGSYKELMEKRGIFAQLASGGEWMD
ncbi:P-loop containing nucleoside triphosphate hydrolase protein [Cytidiella melzeri]|nr:P-loop containing nucleoside triphosphate hydrolase protein [Cytidiella melzeri]